MSERSRTLVQVKFGRWDPQQVTGQLYTYEVEGDVTVGDVVTCPGNWSHPDPQPATVVKLGSSYTGPASRAKLVERSAEPW